MIAFFRPGVILAVVEICGRFIKTYHDIKNEISKNAYWLHTLTDTSGELFIAELDADVDRFLVSVLGMDVKVDGIPDEEMGIVLLFALVVIKNSNLLSICCSTVYNFSSNILLFNNRF